MKTEDKIRLAFLAEASIFLGIVIGVFLTSQSPSQEVYEVLAALLAAKITTMGLYEMIRTT